jgi:hypothetical protein
MPIYKLTVGSANFVFVHPHIPKTGGTAVSHFFHTKLGAQMYYGIEMHSIRPLTRCPPQHYHYAILNELFLLERATVSFCVVRNPITRIESDYIWAMTKSTMKDRWMSFDDWISYVFDGYTRNPYFLANHIRPQYEFTGPKINKIFKYEDGLSVAIKHVLELAGVPLNSEVVLDEINTRKESISNTGSNIVMRDETREKIMNFYNKDFEFFGYK